MGSEFSTRNGASQQVGKRGLPNTKLHSTGKGALQREGYFSVGMSFSVDR